MDTPRSGPLETLTPEQQEWARHSESLWRRAHQVSAAYPNVDPGDVYHALRCLELTPAERLVEGRVVDDFALTPAERALLGALRTRGVKYLIIGMGRRGSRRRAGRDSGYRPVVRIPRHRSNQAAAGLRR